MRWSGSSETACALDDDGYLISMLVATIIAATTTTTIATAAAEGVTANGREPDGFGDFLGGGWNLTTTGTAEA